MARLPQPGADSGSWGNILNEYLLQSHDSGGVLKNDTVGPVQLKSDSVTAAAIATGVVSETHLSMDLRAKVNSAASDADAIDDSTTIHKFTTASDIEKLATVESGATANDTDANLKNRTNHTGTQPISSVTGLQSVIDTKADDSNVVHRTGSESVGGNKTFTGDVEVAVNKQLRFSSSSATGGIAKNIAFYQTDDYSRPWLAWYDRGNVLRAATGWHSMDYESGTAHNRYEIKTNASASNVMLTRMAVDSGVDTGNVYFNYVNDLMIEHGKYEPNAPVRFRLRGMTSAAGTAADLFTFAALTDSSDFTLVSLDPKTLTNTRNARMRFFRDTNTSGDKSIEVFKGDGTNTATLKIVPTDGSMEFRSTGGINLDGSKITNAPTPTAAGDVANKSYVDTKAATATSAGLMRMPKPSTQTPPANMLQAHSAGHGWSAHDAAGSTINLNDTSDFFLGTQSIKITTGGTGVASAVRKAGMALDCTGMDVRLWFKYDDPSKLAAIRIYLSDSQIANHYNKIVIQPAGANANPIGNAGEWIVVDVPFSSMASQGSPTRNSIDTFSFTCIDNAGGPLNVSFGGFALVPADSLNQFPNGVVSLTFDDSYVSQYTIARPYLDKYGYRGTLFPVIGLLDTAGMLTSAQTKLLWEQGWEIGGHASTAAAHAQSLVGMTQDQRITELESIRQWAVTNGYPMTSYAYPNGYWSRVAAADVSRYFDSARLAFTNYPTAARPENQFWIRAANAGTQQASLNGFVDQVKSGRGWLNVIFHDIKSTGATSNDISVANFYAFIDYCHSQGVAVRTQAEVISRAI